MLLFSLSFYKEPLYFPCNSAGYTFFLNALSQEEYYLHNKTVCEKCLFYVASLIHAPVFISNFLSAAAIFVTNAMSSLTMSTTSSAVVATTVVSESLPPHPPRLLLFFISLLICLLAYT